MYPDTLLECARIAKDRGDQYGSIQENFDSTSRILFAISKIQLSPHEIAMVHLATKLSRLNHKWKEDSAMDAANYLLIADELRLYPLKASSQSK